RVLELAVGADLDARGRAEPERLAEHGLGVVVAGDRPERLTASLVVPPDRCLLAQDPPRRMRIARHEHVEVPEVDLVDRRGMRGHGPSLAGPLYRNFGGRFSRKAARPSWPSGSPARVEMEIDSASSCSSNVAVGLVARSRFV